MISNLADLDKFVNEHVIEPFDHRSLNEEVRAFQNAVPTSEILCIEIFRRRKISMHRISVVGTAFWNARTSSLSERWSNGSMTCSFTNLSRSARFEIIPVARGNLRLEFRHFEIQVTMIHALHDFAFENFFQVLQIEDHSGDGIRFAGDCNFKSVIVAVAVRIVALAKNAFVLRRG